MGFRIEIAGGGGWKRDVENAQTGIVEIFCQRLRTMIGSLEFDEETVKRKLKGGK